MFGRLTYSTSLPRRTKAIFQCRRHRCQHGQAILEPGVDAADRGAISVTATMPMITPNAVSTDRILFARICAHAIRNDSVIS